MNKKFILLLVFAILVEAISTHVITKSSNVHCDASGKETFDLEVKPSGSIAGISEFKVTLKNGQDDKEGLKATCILKEFSSDMLDDSKEKASDLKEFISDEDSDNKEVDGTNKEVEGSSSDSTGETKDSDTSMAEKGSDSSSIEKDSTEEEDSNKVDASDSTGETKDSDTNMADKDSDSSSIDKDSAEKEDSYTIDSSDSTIPDNGRRLEENGDPVTFVCSLEGLSKAGSYQITVEGTEITSAQGVTVELISCKEGSDEFESDKISKSNEGLLSDESDLSDNVELSSIEIDKGKSDIHLSFRQVSKFNLDTWSFSFFGLTTQDIRADFSFFFMIFLITGDGKGLTPVKAECKIKEAITLGNSPIAQAEFTCAIPQTTGVESIEIASCDEMAGLPIDETLLNPKLTDEGIASGALKDKSTQPIPQLAEVDMNSFNFYNVSKGTFQFSLTIASLSNEIKVGKTFELFFNGIKFLFEIIKIEGTTLNFDAKIFGELTNQPIAFEQTVVTINGTEAFVLPGFLTKPITTEGIPIDETGPSDNEKSSSEETGPSDNEKSSSEETGPSDNEKSSSEETGPSDKGEKPSDEGSDQREGPTQGGTNQSNQTNPEDITDSPELEEEKKEAEEKLKIFITFRQLNGFAFVPGTISFNLFALITQTLNTPYSVKLLFNLISTEGIEDDTKEFECKLENSVTVGEGKTESASFKCENSTLNESITYTSLRLNSSEEVAGIPFDDETALNPVLTEEAINNGEIKDATKTPVPPTFVFETIDTQTCDKDGKFSLKGKLDKETTIPNKFTLPLTYPPNTVITCTFGEGAIDCIADESLEGSVMIEQQIITEGSNELFILKKVNQSGIKCENGLKLQAEEKAKVDISFRQVSHIEQKAGGNGLRFFFAAFVNSNLAKDYIVEMNVIVIIKEQKVEKVAKCSLIEAVEVTGGKKKQADFNCDVDLESGEEVKPEDLTISTNNENIGGCGELTEQELSPNITQEAIDEKSDNPLVQVLDYKLDENKNKIPPTFTLGSMNFNKCSSKGKIKIVGQFSEEVTEEMTFELPFTFPKTKVKCTVESAQANTDVEITCKMQKMKGGLKFKNLVIEPRLLKKKSMEMLYIEQKTMTLDGQECRNFNEIKKERAKNRMNAPFTFLQLGRPSGYTGLFFLALTRKKFAGSFRSLRLTINVTLTVERSRRLRNLDTLELDEPVSVTCNPKSDAQTDNSLALDCSSDKEKRVPVSSELEDDQIGGAPENITVDKNPNPDYSKIEHLKEFDSLPNVTINNITSDNCSNTGKYNITGTYEGELQNSVIKHNIKIPFATPDSSGLCNMSVVTSDKTIHLSCDNTDSFDVSEIIISPQTVNNETDSKPLFKITNDFIAPSQFACAISDNSLAPNETNPGSTSDQSEEPDDSGNVSGDSKTRYSKNSSGLGGGAIAGIVIACVVVVAAVAAVIALTKSGAFASKSAVTATSIDNSSTVNRFKMDEQNPNMV